MNSIFIVCRNKLDLNLTCFHDNQILLFYPMRTLNKKEMKYRAHTGIPLGNLWTSHVFGVDEGLREIIGWHISYIFKNMRKTSLPVPLEANVKQISEIRYQGPCMTGEWFAALDTSWFQDKIWQFFFPEPHLDKCAFEDNCSKILCFGS